MAVGRNQWYHFIVGAPPSLVYFSGDWDVHWGYGILTHGHMSRYLAGLACTLSLYPPVGLARTKGGETKGQTLAAWITIVCKVQAVSIRIG